MCFACVFAFEPDHQTGAEVETVFGRGVVLSCPGEAAVPEAGAVVEPSLAVAMTICYEVHLQLLFFEPSDFLFWVSVFCMTFFCLIFFSGGGGSLFSFTLFC